jgi:hypothetical protein
MNKGAAECADGARLMEPNGSVFSGIRLMSSADLDGALDEILLGGKMRRSPLKGFCRLRRCETCGQAPLGCPMWRAFLSDAELRNVIQQYRKPTRDVEPKQEVPFNGGVA